MGMKNIFGAAIWSLAGMMCFSSAALAQTGQPRPSQGNTAHSPWKFYATDRATGDGGPAPKRSLTGTWAGPGSGAGPSQFAGGGDTAEGRPPLEPSLTPFGKQLMSQNKPLQKYSPAATNDPHVRYCDPFGFPQNMTNEIRGVSFAEIPNRVIILIQYMDMWREVWTDGRTLPTNVGLPGKDSLSPRFNGYSVGRWEDDYNFVVDTTGLDDRTWLTAAGYPHTTNAHVQERYTRTSQNDLTLTITIDDPKVYTKPFELGTRGFKWFPSQQVDEWLCVPSEVSEYLSTIGDPAGSDPEAAPAPRPGR
jgi:hypothetical protein